MALSITISLVFISCSKLQEEEVPLFKAMILEEKTNAPLAARIDFYRCKDFDSFFGGCLIKEIFSTGYSGADGIFTYTNNQAMNADAGIIVSKDKYWDGNLTEKEYLIPEAWINLHLKTKYNYAGTGYVVIQVAGETKSGSSFYFKAPADSIIKLRIYGNQVNNLNWFVTSTDLSNCIFYCPMDTLQSGIFPVTAGKWETSSGTLDY